MRFNTTHISKQFAVFLFLLSSVIWTAISFHIPQAASAPSFEIKNVLQLSAQELATEISSMNTTKSHLESQVVETKNSILDNKKTRTELGEELNKKTDILKILEKIDKTEKKIAEITQEITTLQAKENPSESDRKKQTQAETKKIALVSELDKFITSLKTIDDSFDTSREGYSTSAEIQQVSSRIETIKSDLKNTKTERKNILRTQRNYKKELSSLGSYIKKLIKQSVKIISGTANLGSSSLGNSLPMAKITETTLTKIIELNTSETDNQLHDCWFGNSFQKITLGEFIGYLWGNTRVIMADEVMLLQNNPPASNDSADGIYGYAGNNIWEDGITGASPVSLDVTLSNYFFYRTNIFGSRRIEIPKSKLNFFWCFAQNGRPESFLTLPSLNTGNLNTNTLTPSTNNWSTILTTLPSAPTIPSTNWSGTLPPQNQLNTNTPLVSNTPSTTVTNINPSDYPLCTGTIPPNAIVILWQSSSQSHTWRYEVWMYGPYAYCSFKCPGDLIYNDSLCVSS